MLIVPGTSLLGSVVGAGTGFLVARHFSSLVSWYTRPPEMFANTRSINSVPQLESGRTCERCIQVAGILSTLTGAALTSVAGLCLGFAYGQNAGNRAVGHPLEEVSSEFTMNCAYAACAGLVTMTAGSILLRLAQQKS